MENEKLTPEYLLKIYNETPWKFANITPEKMAELFKNPGFAYYKPVKETPEITGDSGEYEYLTEAVELSKDVEGMCCEIGLRRGMGTKLIIDAVRQFCPDKTVISVDPFGSIPYVGREHIGEIRLDYDNPMKIDCMIAMWNYVRENPVRWRPECLTDYEFFEKYADGVPKYDIDRTVEVYYSMAHLDGPHNYEHVTAEFAWLNERMKPGATIVIDDCTIDFINIEPVNEFIFGLGWSLYKQGVKKNIYLKE